MAIIFCCGLTCAVLAPAAKADNWNQMTKVSFSEPVQIPGRVLPVGTYWFVLQDDDSDRNIVQIYREDWKELYATLLSVPTDRGRATEDTEIELVERPHEQPEALLKWFYPGTVTGHEFLYSSKREREFRQEAKRDVVVPATGL
jgi:hypothetical protein